MSQRKAAIVVGMVALIWSMALPSAEAAQPAGVVTLVHGVRGLVADVYLDGQPILEVFEPERVTDPLTVPAGPHSVEVRPTGAAADSAPLLSATLMVVADVRQSAVVHLDGADKPTVSVYRDASEVVGLGDARVIVRHTAAAPSFQLTIDSAPVGNAVTGGSQTEQVVGAGSHLIGLSATGSVLLPPREITFAEGTSTALYLVGSASASNLTWLAAPIPTTATMPAAVRTGNSPLDDGSTWLPSLLVTLVCIGASVATTAAYHRRRHDPRPAGGAAFGIAGLTLSLAALGFSGRNPGVADRDRSAVAGHSRVVPFGKILGVPEPKVATSAPLVVQVGSRPADLDHLATRSSTRPETIAIEPGGIVARVVATAADPTTSEMTIPDDPRVVGWYEHGPLPGESGSAVIAGHVAFDGRHGAFAELASVEPGAIVLVSFDDGSVHTFRVEERRAYAKADLPAAELFRRHGNPTLALITCGGTYDRAAHAYTDNIVVLATPI